jgi:cytochrome P450
MDDTLAMQSRLTKDEIPVRLNGEGDSRQCTVKGYAEAIQVLTSDAEVERLTRAGTRPGQKFTELPRWLGLAMSRQRCEALRPGLERLASDLAGTVMTRGQADLIEDFTIPFSFSGLCSAVGVPASQHPALYAWHQASPHTAAEVEDPHGPHWQSLHQLVAPLVTTETSGQGLAQIMASEIRAGHLATDQAIMALGLLVLSSAHPSLTRLISDTLLLLLIDPDKRAALIACPGKIAAALEEMLRFATPSFQVGPRITRCPMRIGEVQVPGGTQLKVVIGAANRDPRRFSDPGRIDFDRDEAQHLAFGFGSSYCPGARLARTQAEIAIRTMLPYLEQLTLAIPVERIEWSNRRAGYNTMLDTLLVTRRN